MTGKAAAANLGAMTDQKLTYNSYLRVPDLLELQIPQSEPPHHDEMLFIVIHQTYELWFKLILHELEVARDYMRDKKVLRARHFIRRVVEIMQVLVRQIHVLETMAPVEFLEFRHRLQPASGFQSTQFREVEFFLGLKDEQFLEHFETVPTMRARLERRLAEPSLREVFYDMLRELGFDVPALIDKAALSEDKEARVALAKVLVPLYQNPEEHLELNLLAESLLDLDQGLMTWREHHVRVVERVIGFKHGTGGSEGVGYLKTTIGKKVFPEIWDVRTLLEHVVA